MILSEWLKFVFGTYLIAPVMVGLKPVAQVALKPVVQVAWSALVDRDCPAVEELGYFADSIPSGLPLRFERPGKKEQHLRGYKR